MGAAPKRVICSPSGAMLSCTFKQCQRMRYDGGSILRPQRHQRRHVGRKLCSPVARIRKGGSAATASPRPAQSATLPAYSRPHVIGERLVHAQEEENVHLEVAGDMPRRRS